jgi:hypothetical protein
MVNGTSFSAPLVAGAAALIKSARPGLTVDQYRSLLMNTAAAAQTRSGDLPAVQQTGAGMLDLETALRSTVSAYPASMGFGAGGSTVEASRVLTLTNIGPETETFEIGVIPRKETASPAPVLNTVELAPGASVDVPVMWKASGLTDGTYEGVFAIRGSVSGTAISLPYWYAATSGVPAHISVLYNVGNARRRSTQRDAILFRATDVSGLPLADVTPEVTVVSGDAAVRDVRSHDSLVPGMFGVDVELGISPGASVFRIRLGEVTADVSIAGM